MRIVKRKRIVEWSRQYPDAAKALLAWYDVASRQNWHSLRYVRRWFPHADGVSVRSRRIVTVFNIRKNTYRLLTAIHYDRHRIYVMRFLTHAEYDKDQWKEQL